MKSSALNLMKSDWKYMVVMATGCSVSGSLVWAENGKKTTFS